MYLKILVLFNVLLPFLVSARSGKITFQKYELPALTPDIQEILDNENIGSKFMDLWRSAMEMSAEFKVNYDEDVKLTLLVPKDEAFAKVSRVDHQNDNNVNEARGLPDPFLMDFQLTQRVVTNHIIAQFSGISILNDGGQINVTSIGYHDLIFEKNHDDFYVNGIKAKLVFKGETLRIFCLEDLLVDAEFLRGRLEANMMPVKTLAEMGDLLPLLEPRMSFGLRQVNAHLFGTIWRQTKHELQILKAKETSNLCNLPKEIGPCRGLQARFFFNSDLGTCEPFAFGGCDGNANNFQSLKDCANNCIEDQLEFNRIKAQICQLPIQQFQGIRRGKQSQCQPSEKYHFDIHSQSCLLVEYSGCFGTDNLFDTLKDCQSFCGNLTETFELVEKPRLKSRLTIFAAEDDAIENAIHEAGLDINDHFLFARDPLLGLRFLLKHISYESCDDENAVIETLDGMEMNCSALESSGNRLDGIDYTLIGLKKVPFPISTTETRFYAAPGNQDKFETEKRLKFIMATAELPDWPSGMEPPFGHFKNGHDQSSQEDSLSSIVCSLPLETGTRTKTSVREERFHFDKDLGFCKKFSYEGQGGNLNNFKTSQECKEICGDFKGLVSMVSLKSASSNSTSSPAGGLAITQANSEADVWMFGAIFGHFDGVYLVKNAQPHQCQDASGTQETGIELHEMAALNAEEVLIRVPDFSLYDYDGRAMIILYSRNATGIQMEACGVIEMSSYPKRATVKFGSQESMVLTQEGPWDLLDVSDISADCEGAEEFSFYANRPNPNCIEAIEESADEWPKEGEAIIRGPKGISGRLSLVQKSMHEYLHAFGNVIGLDEDKEYRLSIHEPSSSSNCMAAGNLFNPLRHDYQGISTAKILGDLGNVDVGTNHAAYIDVAPKESQLSLDSVLGKIIVISSIGSYQKAACGFIQTRDQINQAVSAEAIIDKDDILGQIELTQEGIHDFVHVSGNVFGLHNESSYGFGLYAGSCQDLSGHFEQPLDLEKVDFIDDFEGSARHEIDTVAQTNESLNSLIGQSLVLFENGQDIVGCSQIERTLDFMPDLCKSPEVSDGNVCLFSDFAWSYDAKLAKCIVVKTAFCPQASKNQFASERDCMNMCPVVPKYFITLVPSKEALANFMQSKDNATLTEDFRRKFILCHTISVSSTQDSNSATMETMCGEALNLKRTSDGWYLDENPIYSINYELTWFNLYIDHVLTGNGLLV